MPQNVDQRFQVSASPNASSVSWATGAWFVAPPALLTRMSMRPKRSTVPSTIDSTPSRVFTSAAM